MATFKFLSISELKSELGVISINIVRNPKSGKLFAECSNGIYLRVQQNIKSDLPIKFMYNEESEDLTETGCLINVKESDNNVQFSL